MRVCEYYPHVEMTIKSEVYDDEDAHTITAGAIVTLTVTLKRQNLKVLFDKETPVVEDKQQILAIDDQASGENGENNGDLTEKPAGEEVAKVNNKSTKQPWEKQKKKPKYAKSKPKSKAKVNNKVNNNTSTNKKVDSTATAASDKNKIEDIEVNIKLTSIF
jgi:translocation protein SEC63